MTIFRTELRRSIAPWAGLAMVAVALGFLLPLTGPWWHEPAPWLSQTTTTALWVRYMQVFLWPMALGVGALQGMRDSRSGASELLSTVPRPAWQRGARLAGAVGLLSALGFVVSFLAGAAGVATHDGLFSWTFVPVIVIGALAMVAGTSLGLAVGRLLPHPLVAPALSVVGLAFSIVSWLALEGDGSSLLSPQAALLASALALPQSAFVTTATTVDVGQAVWFVGLAVTGFLLLAANSVRGKLLGVLPMVIAAVIALLSFPTATGDVYTVDTVAAQQVCDGPVCVSRVHRAMLPVLSAAGKDALTRLAALPNAPTRVREWTRPEAYDAVPARDPGVVYVDLQRGNLARTGSADLRRMMLAGAGAPSCAPFNVAGPSDTAARMISAAYFTGTLSTLPDQSRYALTGHPGAVQAMWATFHALPADVALSRIVAMRKVFLACRGNALDALLPGVTW